MDLLQRVLANNARFPVDEAEKFRAHTESDALLAEYAEVAEPSGELTYAVIRLLRYLKRQRAALELMQRRRPHIAEKRREIDFYELELHYHGGERELGDRLLENFQAAGGKMRPSWKRALDKIQRNFELQDIRAQVAALERGIAGLEVDVDVSTHLPLLQAILPEPNRALEVLVFIRQRMATLRAIATPTAYADLDPFARYHSATLLFACGFGWSGSGAVAGFLSQHREVALPFGTSELGYLQGRFGRPGFMPFLAPGTFGLDAMRKLLARFFIESIVALGDIRHHYSLLMQSSGGEHGNVGVLGRLMDDFNATMLGRDALADVQARKRVLGAFLQRLLSVQGGSHVLLNNVLLAPNLALAKFMDNARFIVVERDARDQYVARRVESGDAEPLSVDAFIDTLRTARAGFQACGASLPPAARAARLRVVRFEEFLQDDAVRGGLLDWLGLPRIGIAADGRKFDAPMSARNVGIHHGHLGAADEARIASELGRYMD